MFIVERPPLNLCTGCRTCELACSFRHEGVFNPRKSRIRIVRELTKDCPIYCRHCEGPPCVRVCPVNAFVQDERTGAFTVDEDACTGCGACVQACPFGAIALDPGMRRALKCDLCGGDPACVKVCPEKIIHYARSVG